MINHSRGRWLYADEIVALLSRGDSVDLTLSTRVPPFGTVGLFIYRDRRSWSDSWQWNHVGYHLAVRRTVTENGASIYRTESTGHFDANFRRRIHRKSQRSCGCPLPDAQQLSQLLLFLLSSTGGHITNPASPPLLMDVWKIFYLFF